MADSHVTVSVQIVLCTRARLIEHLAQAVAEHVAENRHPDGIAPAVLAEDIVGRLESRCFVFVDEEGRPLP